MKISSNTTVTLDASRSIRNLNLDFSGFLDLNGNNLNVQGNGAVFTYNGGLRNSNAILSAVNFVGDGVPGAITQTLSGTNGGCSTSNPCNLELRLVNGVTLRTVRPVGALVGASTFNVNFFIDTSSTFDLNEGLNFIGSFDNFRVINNTGSIRNGRLSTERLVTIMGNGTFDSELAVGTRTTQVQGNLPRFVGIQSTGILKLTGEMSASSDFSISSGGTLDLNGHNFLFRGNNKNFVNRGAVANTGNAATMYFTGNGTPGAVTQSLMSNGGSFASSITERCADAVRLVMVEDAQLGSVVVETGSVLDMGSRTLALLGPGTPLVVDGTIVTANGTLEMRGNAAQSVPTDLNGAAFNNLTINNPAGVDIPTTGSGPVTIPGTLTLALGTFSPNGNLNLANGATIARSQGSFASPPNFGATINLRYLGFSSIVGGVEVPTQDILNNLTVETVGTISINSGLIVNGVFSLGSGAQLSCAKSTVFSLKGSSVTNLGTLSCPSTVFASSNTQTLSGNGGWLGASVSFVGSGSVSLAGPVGFNNALLINASNINTGNNFLTFRGASFVNQGTISGNVQTQDSNVTLDAGETGFNASFRVWSEMATAKGRINSSLTVQSQAATLRVDAGNLLNVAGSVTVNGPLVGDGTFRANGAVTSSAQISVAEFQMGGTTQSFGGTGALVGNTFRILSGSTTTLTANKQLATLAIDSGGVLNFSNRTLSLSGPGTPFTNAGNYNSTNSLVDYNGLSLQTLSPTVPTYFNLSLSNPVGVDGFPGLVVNGLTRVKSGTFQLQASAFKDLQIDEGSILSGSNGSTAKVSGNWINNGEFVSNLNTLDFNGPGEQSIGGSSVSSFHSLTTSGASNVVLLQNIAVHGHLALGADILTGSNMLTMPSGGTTDGLADVVGATKRTGLLPGISYSFGNPFNSITFAPVGTVPNEVTVNLSKSTPSGLPSAVQRTYSITEAGGNGFSATLRLHYRDTELNGNSEANLKLFRFAGGWIGEAVAAADTMNNWVEASGISQFSSWTFMSVPPFATIRGRITASNGYSPFSVGYVTITYADGTTIRRITNQVGYYRIVGVRTGELFTISLYSKRHRFEPNSLQMSIIGDLTDLNFVSQD